MIARLGQACRVAALAVLIVPSLAAGDDGAQPARVPTPADLAADVPGRMDEAYRDLRLAVVPAGVERRRASAERWLDELLSPLETSDCAAVLSSTGRSITVSRARRRLARAGISEDRPIAAEDGAGGIRVLVPESLPAQGARAKEVLQSTGLLPLEVALSGEWARAVAIGHTGPALADPLLRSARAARLEGVARLVGVTVAVEGGGMNAAELGTGLLRAGGLESGLDCEAMRAASEDGLVRAFLGELCEDGPRWALYHFLKGGHDGLLAALERPLVLPRDLLRPGAPAAGSAIDRPGCSLGPRGALAFLLGADASALVSRIVDDRFWVDADGSVAGRLELDSGGVAEDLVERLVAAGHEARLDGQGVDVAVAVRADP